jgi:hypothetical protein
MKKKHIDYTNWSKDELVKELKRIKETTYGLVWHRDVPQEKIDVLINPDARTPEEMFANEVAGKPFPVLKEVKNKEVVSDKKDQTHILIEGDNYHSLAVLNFTHQEAIDVIYIDPPYNTGENDFIYNDNFVDKDDPYRHSKWLSFMEKRLKLAFPLLKQNGVIFISIDNNEFAQLKLLCDEIFDEKNFLGCLTWIKRTKSTNSGKAKKMIQQKTEYVFVYGRQSAMNFEGFNLMYSEATKKYPHNGKLGKCRFENLEATDYGRKKRDTMKFPILGVKPREGRRWQIGAGSKSLSYDQNGEEHYNLISAMHKSLRDSDGDGAIYWIGRMLASGEDPRYIARRMMNFASEDIYDPQAIILTNSVYDICEKIGMPECELPILNAAYYLADAPKDNRIYMAQAAMHADIKEYGNLGVPLHLRNAPTTLMKEAGYGK